MSWESPSPATSRDHSPWRVFKARSPSAQAAQGAGFGARPRVSRAAATLPFRDGLCRFRLACIGSMHRVRRRGLAWH